MRGEVRGGAGVAGAGVAVLALIAMAGMVACAPARTGPEPVRLTILVGFSTGTDNRQIEVHRELAREFNASHQDIQIEFLTVNHVESAEKYRQLHAEGRVPDLVLPIGVAAFSAWRDEWLDLAPLLRKKGVDLSDVWETPLKSLDYPASLRALPLGIYPAVLFYNVDMFERAKLATPPHQFNTAGWTYDALLQDAIRLTRDRSGKTPLDKGFDPGRLIQYGYDGTDWAPLLAWPAKFGGAPLGISDDGRTALANSQAWKDSFRWLRDSIHTWFVRPASVGGSSSPVYGENDPIGSNATAMWEAFSWIRYAWSGWNSNFRWDVAAIPAGPTGRVVAQANLELGAIPAAARHPDESLEVLLWLVQAENQKRLSVAWGCLPMRHSLSGWWIDEQKKINAQVDWPVFIEAIDWLGIPNHEAWVPAYKQVNELYERTLAAITTGQVADTDQAAEDLNLQVQAVLDEYWKKKDAK